MGWGRAWLFPRDRRRSGGLWRLSPRGKGACSYYVALRHPPPRPRFLEGILVRPSPASPTPPALPGGDTRTSLSGNPHPARAARSSPAPSRGQGQCLRYPVGSRARFFSGLSPCSGPWGYRHGGRGPGRGKPSPRGGIPVRPSPATPTPPALRAPPPPPPAGRGQCLR